MKDAAPRPIIWDNHGCMPLKGDERFLPELERYRAAGVAMASINIGYGEMGWEDHLLTVASMRRWISLRPDRYRLVASSDDIRRSAADGKLGVAFDIEGMVPVEDNVALVQLFYDLGVRWMLIAYNRNNKAGGGCMDDDGGLRVRGREIIDEMERVGMVLCLSHAGPKTVAEALDYARNPAIFSHSNPRGDHAHVRNVGDALLRACAAKGGVVGLSGIGPFLGADNDLLARFLQQLRYLIDLIGADHVGLGLDYVFDQDGLARNVRQKPHLYPAGVDGGLAMLAPETVPQIADALSRFNLSDAEVRGVLGENWLRVADAVWR